jgi:aminotransferase
VRDATAGTHGYAPFSGLRELREAIAARYETEYGVALDPEREIAVVPAPRRR